MIGTLLQGYRILELIKEGSVGTVWKAANARNQVFAIKQISAVNAAVPRKLRQFRKEAAVTRRLHHKHIIKVYEYLPTRPQPCFVMENFVSENLKYAMWYAPERVHAHEFSILRRLAEALSYSHEQGVVHRDVKPDNVLVSPESDVRLIDYSLAQTWWDRLNPFARRTEGTPLYMAPEQIRGQKCDGRTDIYAFGVTMFELLTKRPPYLGTTDAAILQKHLREPIPSMKSVVPTISSDLDAFVHRMLAKKPEDRFRDMTPIVHELAKWEKKDTRVRILQVEPAKAKHP